MPFIDNASWFHHTLMWASWLVFPFFYIIYHLYKKHRVVLSIFLLCLSVLFIYSRFIEPQLLFVYSYDHDIESFSSDQPLEIAVVSDAHIGVYKSPRVLRKAIARINEEQVDIVLIPGDFIYHLRTLELDKALAPYGALSMPVFVVSGNHDTDPSLQIETRQVLQALANQGVQILENKTQTITVNNQTISLAGIGDIWNNDDDISIVRQMDTNADLNILLAHNPDTVFRLPRATDIDLMISGHTHGGQVRIPFLYKYVIPTIGNFDYGWYKEKGLDIFVTSGIGEVGLPLRFGRPPRVDILTIY